MNRSDVILRPLSPADRSAYLSLYGEAFPPAERKAMTFMTEGPLSPAYDVLVIETPICPVSGMVILVRHGDLILLDYFAVSPALRGMGIGRAALPLIRDFCRERHPGLHLFLEIEVPAKDCPNPVQRVRRKAFYLSCGLTETGIRAHVYGSEMELLAYPEDAPCVTLSGYAGLLEAVFPADMVPFDLVPAAPDKEIPVCREKNS